MQPDSLTTMVVTILAAVAGAAGTGWGWDHARGWWRWPVRAVALVLCAGLSLASAGIGVNHELRLYPTWGSIASGGRGDAGPVPQPAAASAQPSADPGGSEIVRFTVAGHASHITMSALAYLPAGYRSAANASRRYPVIEAFDGFPGSPNYWVKTMRVQEVLDREIAAGRMAPTVVVLPYQTRDAAVDTECVDAVGGAKFDTFLAVDVPAAVVAQFRVRTDRAAWGTIGTSTGGFCAVNLALRHTGRYAAAASLSGYFEAITDRTTGDLYRGDSRARNENSPLWRLANLPVPATAVYLSCARDDRHALDQLQRFQAAARAPLAVSTDLVPQGGHSSAVWRSVLPAALDWLSGRLAAARG